MVKVIDFGFSTCIEKNTKVNLTLFRLKSFVVLLAIWLLKLFKKCNIEDKLLIFGLLESWCLSCLWDIFHTKATLTNNYTEKSIMLSILSLTYFISKKHIISSTECSPSILLRESLPAKYIVFYIGPQSSLDDRLTFGEYSRNSKEK